MGSLRNIALFVLTVSALTFIAFFGRLPALRNTPIGFLHRVLWIHIPKSARRLDARLTGGRLSSSGARLSHYLLYEKHPLVIIFFLGLTTASAFLFIRETWSLLSLTDRFLVPPILTAPYAFTYLSNTRSPAITFANHASHQLHYPYDYILYHPNRICRTCHFSKPARSKHCSICGTCIARADHHCIWVNNCLGRGNYKYFLALLLSTAVLLAYGASLAYRVLRPQVRDFQAGWYSRRTLASYGSADGAVATFNHAAIQRINGWLDALSAAVMIGGLSVAGVGLLALLTAPLPAGLLCYHIYLIWAGMTTNESGKWADLRDDMADGMVWVGTRDSAEDSQEVESIEEGSEDGGAEWPLRSTKVVVRTRDGGPPIFAVDDETASGVVNGSWRRCWRLGELDNIYDLGFWDNLQEVLLH
ncbi:palmitoyltransferase swf1 [Coniosporium tulheliwenetii]|uniref:Palmitoyltransferase swf1 n=1 Tax=Coniosporium tulheliwenetii TaxID=3383036 RepID=A0ACC2YYR9_9PEZI|nr:palmitoyltransferase swf1 [Cladosporium sp. JES 115]